MADDNATAANAGEADENGFGFGGERDLGERTSDPGSAAPATSANDTERREYQRRRSFDAGDLPEGMEARYLAERRRLTGEQRYYETASDTKPAFRDKGDRLVAENNSRDLIRDMLEIAEHRGWDRVRVSGTEEFRREVWRESALRGIEVDGYRPKDREVQEVTRARDKKDARANFVSSGDERSPPPSYKDRITDDEGASAVPPRSPKRADFTEGVAGRLVDVGEARYAGKLTGKITPYADLVLDDGRQERAWGVGLPAALQESSVAVGDQIILRRLGTERVEVTVAVLNAESGERSSEARDVNRNRWAAERILAPEMQTALTATELAGDRPGREAGIDLDRAVAPQDVAGRSRVRAQPGDDDHVERAANPGEDILGIRTAPTRDTSAGDQRMPTTPIEQVERAYETGIAVRPDLPRRDADPIVTSALEPEPDPQNRRNGLERQTASRITPGADAIGSGNNIREEKNIRNKNLTADRRDVDQISTGSDHKPNRELADRFRMATSPEAARDPQLRAAQSQFIAAKAIVTSTLGHEPVAAQRLIAQSRETIARAIERGKAVPAAELHIGKTVTTDRDRPEPERTRADFSPSTPTPVTKAPTRNRSR